jgi:uncharacterized membrane protein YeiH
MKKLSALFTRVGAFRASKGQVVLAALVSGVCQPVMAGILSKAVCAPYRQMVDNELFIALAAISAVILVIVWKTGNSSGVLAKGIGLLAAVMFAMQIENILYATFKVSVCT